MIDHLSDLRRFRLSPRSYRRVTLFAVWALAFIIVTGAAVRLTGSGLGCTDWPTCNGHSLVAPWQYRPMIEFGNRVVTGAVSMAVIAAVLASHIRTPCRRDLSALSWGLVAGLVGQIVLGGESVRHQLAPPFIMGHFLLSMVLLADAVVLHHRAGWEDGPLDPRGRATGPVGPVEPLVAKEHLVMGRLVVVAAAATVALGTVVTSSGPHGGDPKAKRLGYSVHDVARLHSSVGALFGAFTVITLWTLMRSGAPPAVMRRGEVVLLVLVMQGAIGYLQYFSGVPAWLVAIHVTLAAALWAVTLQFLLALTTRPRPRPSDDGGGESAAGHRLLTTA